MIINNFYAWSGAHTPLHFIKENKRTSKTLHHCIALEVLITVLYRNRTYTFYRFHMDMDRFFQLSYL